MNYTSTRSIMNVSSAQAIASGIAPDGGLFTPTEIPRLTSADLTNFQKFSYSSLAAEILSRFMNDFTKKSFSHMRRRPTIQAVSCVPVPTAARLPVCVS